MDDDGLVARVAAGDDTALRELFSRHAPWLATRLRAVLPAAEVEDVLQETFLAVWGGAGVYRPCGAAGGWLWGIARRQAALLLRRRGPAAAMLPGEVTAGARQAGDPAEVALARADLAAAVASARAARGPGTRGVAAPVRGGPPGSGGGGDAGGSVGHGEKPRPPGPAAAAGGAADRPRGGGRIAMSDMDRRPPRAPGAAGHGPGRR